MWSKVSGFCLSFLLFAVDDLGFAFCVFRRGMLFGVSALISTYYLYIIPGTQTKYGEGYIYRIYHVYTAYI